MKVIFMMLLCITTYLQADDDVVSLPEVTVTYQPETSATSRIEGGKQLVEPHPEFNRTFPDSIAQDAEVSGQATGPQQGSPIIHGFTAYRNILLVDGIRLNNAIMRDGPNQYWGTVDPFTVDSASMYFGQSTMLYGSDAFGSAVNISTRRRIDYSHDGFNWGGRTFYRYASAEDSNIGRLEFEGNYGKKLGFLIGTSLKGFGDMTGGERTGLQPHTNYDEQDADARVDYNLTDKSQLTFVHQHYQSNNAWRVHSTIFGNTLFGNDLGNFLYRYYDQNRELTYLKFDSFEVPWFDEFTVTGSFQHVTEDQFRRKPNQGAFNQGFTDNIAGLNVQAKNNTTVGTFTYGLDYYHDFINSYGTQFKPDGSFASSAVQGPVADNSSYDNLGLYINDDIPIVENRVILSLTSRFNYAAAKSVLIEDASSPTGASPGVNKSWDSFTTGGRLNVGLDEGNHYKTFIGANQGWRAPTIFDLTGDELARSTDVQVPTPGLNPEKFVTYEAGVGYENHGLNATLTYFNTQLENVIIRDPTGAVIDGDTVVKGRNNGTGFIHGVAFKTDYRILPDVTIFAGFGWTEGHLSSFDPNTGQFTERPASRMNPINGNFGIHWDVTQQVFVEPSIRVVGPQDRLSPRDIADTQRIPPGGSKQFELLGIHAGYQFNKQLSFHGAVDNLLNEDYRVLGSGVNGLGRNFIVSAEYKF